MDNNKREKIYRELEEAANRYTLRCLISTVLLMAVIWVLNILGIFIVDGELTKICFSGGMVIVLIVMIVVRLSGYSKSWVKYFLLFSVVLATTLFGVVMTYHAMLLIVLPLMYSAQYTKKVIGITYVMSVVGVAVSVMAGYYFGICDANMVLLTTMTKDHYVNNETMTFIVNSVNTNPWATLPLFFVLPRVMLLSLLVPVVMHISNDMVKKSEREYYLKEASEIDGMTRLYNRNKYREMIREYYPQLDKVGVLFGDLNGLKEANDSLGHEYGDRMIISAARMIALFTNERANAFRIGGDEFVLIAEDITEEEIERILVRWNKILEEKNSASEYPVSISVGYAAGKGADIQDIIKRADQMMYKNKAELKKTENI